MYLAVDIGGTKTLVALFSERGRVLKRIKIPTARGARRFIDDLSKVLLEFRRFKVRVIVVAIPGRVQKNYSVSFGNRDWPEIDLYTPIKKLFDCPIYFENDANLAALYEGSFYPGKTIFLTFSTGIGGGIVEDGANRVALGLPDITEKYKPSTIVLGGPLGKIFKRYVKYLPNLNVNFVRPRRPLESVIYGCFLYAKQRLK